MAFKKWGSHWPSQTNKFLNGKFKKLVNPKDWFALSDYKDIWHRRVMEFPIPILHLEKPI